MNWTIGAVGDEKTQLDIQNDTVFYIKDFLTNDEGTMWDCYRKVKKDLLDLEGIHIIEKRVFLKYFKRLYREEVEELNG